MNAPQLPKHVPHSGNPRPGSFMLLGWLMCLALAGCAPQESLLATPIQERRSALTVGACDRAFEAHQLDHFTAAVQPVRMFDSNGAGLAAGDLDGDGDLDLILANLQGLNSLLWNLGDLRFHQQVFPTGESRAAQIVDVDGDGRLDVVFTGRLGAPSLWRNSGAPVDLTSREVTNLVPGSLPGVRMPAYAMAWGDLDQDGDLDLVTGSYDAELEQILRDSFLFGEGAGVFVYEQTTEGFQPQRLADRAQALSLLLLDLNDDGRQDIIVGNDFSLPDMVWLNLPDGWQAAEPFATTSFSTMSLVPGDIDNNGRVELLATDMMPYADDPTTVATWLPLMDSMHHDLLPGDPQVMSNVLQLHTGVNGYQDAAQPRGVDATGWSWSAQFGDLDRDGLLDLYVTNGMMEALLFAHLPGHELVERNQALRNVGAGYFRPAPEWNLDSSASGRGMIMADLDDDGDLDIVVNNLLAPAQLFENRLCGGSAIEVDLRWPGSGNTQAIGAELMLSTSNGDYTRQVRSASGYLSGEPARAHFGFPADSELLTLDIRWPDGAVSQITELQPDQRLTVTRN